MIPPANKATMPIPFAQERLAFAFWKRDLAVILDHAQDVVAQLANVARHLLFTPERVTINKEVFLHDRAGETGSLSMKRVLVSCTNFRRQFGGTGVFLPVIPNLRLQRNAHFGARMIAIHLPAPLASPFL
jgi:hypothetical protein